MQSRLINDPFSDPGLYVDFRFGRRALLFDLGDVTALSARELMRISDVFVSHAHMDHFAGFDRLLRLCLHRPQPLHLVGPDDFADRVEHRLRSYTWNLLGPDSTDFRLRVSNVTGDRIASVAEFRSQEGFRRHAVEAPALAPGCVLAEEQFRVEAVALDHRIPSLAFALTEPVRVNVWQGALEPLGLPVGAWLNEAKRAVRLGLPDETDVLVPPDRQISLGTLREKVFRVGPGQKIAYVTDAGFTEANIEKIVALADGADQLFIEAAFLDADAGLAAERRHLTAAQAGRLGRRAGVRHLTPFHFSARYLDRPDALVNEARSAFAGLAP